MSWSERCSAAFGRSKTDLGQLTLIIYAVGGFLVRPFFSQHIRCLMTNDSVLSPYQIAAFVVTAVSSCYLFYRWFRLDSVARAAVWQLYGRFMNMVFLGCLFGSASCTPSLGIPFIPST